MTKDPDMEFVEKLKTELATLAQQANGLEYQRNKAIGKVESLRVQLTTMTEKVKAQQQEIERLKGVLDAIRIVAMDASRGSATVRTEWLLGITTKALAGTTEGA